MTTTLSVTKDIADLLRARNPLLWLVTREEARAESFLFEAAASAKYIAGTWDIAEGAQTMAGQALDPSTSDPGTMFKFISERTGRTERNAWIMRDLPVWLQGMPGAVPLRQLCNLVRKLPTVPREAAQAVIILSPSGDVPPELANHTTVIEWPLPDRDEIASLLDGALEAQPDNIKTNAIPNGQRDAAIDAAVGLSAEEAQNCFARSLVSTRRIDPALIASEKRRVIARERVLEWIDPLPGGLDAVGGLENLKAWLVSRGASYTVAFRNYAPTVRPKGALFVGVQGCGKSLTAKAVATAWGVPLLKLDLGALKGKFVGESEGNLRRAFKVIEAIGRCVVWCDEAGKALQGAMSGSADGGVSADQLGFVLTWMEERKASEAFVIATANETDLPPEFIRRFDDTWFVDLPNAVERHAILKTALVAHGRGALLEPGTFALSAVAAKTDGFIGAEVAKLVPTALFAAFADGAREITSDDLLRAAASVVPLTKTAGPKIAAMRKWGQENARAANRYDEQAIPSVRARVLDI
jgi:SpoVK/Ycf46/Vps4 family AAA+-type ATPase